MMEASVSGEKYLKVKIPGTEQELWLHETTAAAVLGLVSQIGQLEHDVERAQFLQKSAESRVDGLIAEREAWKTMYEEIGRATADALVRLREQYEAEKLERIKEAEAGPAFTSGCGGQP